MRSLYLPQWIVGGCAGLLLSGTPLAAQTLYNKGETITVGPGATLTVVGDYEQTAGATLLTPGTTKVSGNVQAAAGSTLNLSAGELEVTGNLTNAGTTTATTGTLRLTGATNQTVDVAGGTVGQLVVNKPAGAGNNRVDLPTDLTVTGPATLTAGMVRTATTSALLLPDGATLVGEVSGRYVQGNVRATKTAVGGSAAVDFGNGAIINPQGNTLGTVVVNRAAGLQQANITYGQNPSDPALKGIDRIWTITPQTQPAAGQPATLTMTWLSDDDNGLTVADFAQATAWRRPTMAAPWVQVGPYQDASARSLSVAAETFSDWTVSAQVSPLPVELLAFDAVRAGETARLTWVTASEKNSAYFEVEVSPTGRDFHPVAGIGRVAAQGTSAQRHAYEATDPALLTYRAAVVYYRLRQVDRDGTVAYSDVRSLRVGGALPGALAATAWPNPFADATGAQLYLTLPTAEPVELTLYDAVGRLVRHTTLTPTAPGELLTTVPGAEAGNRLATGTYVLRVRQGAARVTQRLVRE